MNEGHELAIAPARRYNSRRPGDSGGVAPLASALLIMMLSLSEVAAAPALPPRPQAVRITCDGPRRVGRITLALLLALLCLGCEDRGKPEAIWCETGTGPGEVVYPRPLAYDANRDNFYVIDRVAHVQRLDRNGHCLADWRMPAWQMGKPVGATVGPDGNLWVADTHYHRVVVYTPDGKLLQMFGHEGTGDGQFMLPTDVGFEGGKIFVSEYGGNDRVQVFDHHWHKLYQFGKFGDGDGEFSRPQSMLIEDGLVYLTDATNHRIVVFTTEGKWVRAMGSPGSALGQFRFPYGLADDHEGHLIVSEFGNNRVQMIDKQTGRGLKIWGGAGREPGQLAYPWGVAVDKRGRIVAVDGGNNRIQVFEF